MRNFVQSGDVLDLTAPVGGLASGDPVLIGSLFGIAATAASAGQKVAVQVAGVFRLAKADASAFAEGDAAYWDAAAKKVTDVATDNTLIGHATATAGAAESACLIRLAN